MTRVNAGVNPKRLTDEHLLAEHREIKRLCTLYYKRTLREADGKKVAPLPEAFTLGKGHVLFLLDKYDFTLNRYADIHQECIVRGYHVTNYISNWGVYPLNKKSPSYRPSDSDTELVKSRIKQKIISSPKKSWRYYHKTISPGEAINLLNK